MKIKQYKKTNVKTKIIMVRVDERLHLWLRNKKLNMAALIRDFLQGLKNNDD